MLTWPRCCLPQIGCCYETLGDYKMAVKWLEMLSSLVPTDPGVLAKLGALHAGCAAAASRHQLLCHNCCVVLSTTSAVAVGKGRLMACWQAVMMGWLVLPVTAVPPCVAPVPSAGWRTLNGCDGCCMSWGAKKCIVVFCDDTERPPNVMHGRSTTLLW
jgi:hypothetical protein